MSGVVFETSVNALDTGLKAATALGSPADNVSEAAVLPMPGGVIRSFAYDNIGRLVDARTRKDAQTRHLCRYHWAKQYISNRFVDFGDADIIGAFDDAEDTQAIKVGMSLFDKFGSIPTVLTPQLILDELYFFYRNNKPLHIEICEYHK